MILRNVNPEQGIVEYGIRNKKQYDLLGFYNDELIASLWLGNDGEWRWTKRLYNLETVEEIGEYYGEFSEIVADFLSEVTEWLNDEIAYLRDMYDDLVEEDIPVEE